MTSIFCSEACQYLTPSEQQQNENFVKTGKKGFHECAKYETRLYHYTAHPQIFKCKACVQDASEKGNI
jgi:hypothetical protein